MTENAEEPRPTPSVYAVQFACGGIPEEPQLIEGRENALRFFVETAIANHLEWTDDSSENWIGNDDDEVRLFGPLGVPFAVLAPPLRSKWNGKGFDDVPFTADELAEVEAILATIREDKKAQQQAREVLAEDSTPDRPGGCD